jgi:hypothetical protein
MRAYGLEKWVALLKPQGQLFGYDPAQERTMWGAGKSKLTAFSKPSVAPLRDETGGLTGSHGPSEATNNRRRGGFSINVNEFSVLSKVKQILVQHNVTREAVANCSCAELGGSLLDWIEALMTFWHMKA